MDYEPYDSSGTDDDFPPPHRNRISRGGHNAGNGRPPTMGSIPYPRMSDETDMESKIHQLEQEAYIAILRAFKAQADVISWEKEGLITELRKELRLSNEEHRDLLSRVNADETILRIRDRRQSGAFKPAMRRANQTVHDMIPSTSASRKKQNLGSDPPFPSQSFGGSGPAFHPQRISAVNQPSSSSARHGPIMGAKGKKNKSIPPGHCIPSGGLGNVPADGPSFDPLIGRKVRTRWPDDNSFYEAVITNYDAEKGLHFLVYDKGSQNETWEWVNLSEISPEDIQWEEGPGGPGHQFDPPLGRDNARGAGRGRTHLKVQSRKEFPPSRNGIGKKGPADIQLLQTDTLIKEVERVFGASHPDPVEMEKAMKVLKEHELALTDSIARLADISEGESAEDAYFLHAPAKRES